MIVRIVELDTASIEKLKSESLSLRHCHRHDLLIYILKLYSLCPNLMNLSRGLNPPKTGFHFAPKIEIEKLDAIFSETKHI